VKRTTQGLVAAACFLVGVLAMSAPVGALDGPLPLTVTPWPPTTSVTVSGSGCISSGAPGRVQMYLIKDSALTIYDQDANADGTWSFPLSLNELADGSYSIEGTCGVSDQSGDADISPACFTVTQGVFADNSSAEGCVLPVAATSTTTTTAPPASSTTAPPAAANATNATPSFTG
jgi:hypothetical protein